MSEVILRFKDLDEVQKRKARNKYLDSYALDYEWWDTTYEDAIAMMKIIGIEVDTEYHAPREKGQRGHTTPKLYFSGFGSQGDGACFAGSYNYKPDAIEKLGQATDSEELMRIAVELTLIQLPRRLQSQDYYSANITISGWHKYCHSGTMSIALGTEDADEENIDEAAEDEILQLIRDVADWVYEQLEQAHDWLHCDEYIDERLADEEFDEAGVMI